MRIILASTSPRRRSLIGYVAEGVECISPGFDESAVSEKIPRKRCLVLAEGKCRHAYRENPGSVVIGCDTVVDLDSKLVEKPSGYDAAVEMISSLSGRTHLVHTGVCIKTPDFEESFVVSSEVEFYPVPHEAVEAYCRTTEPYDKAGGYAIGGWAAKYVKSIRGDYYSIEGLPVSAVYETLYRHGILK